MWIFLISLKKKKMPIGLHSDERSDQSMLPCCLIQRHGKAQSMQFPFHQSIMRRYPIFFEKQFSKVSSGSDLWHYCVLKKKKLMSIYKLLNCIPTFGHTLYDFFFSSPCDYILLYAKSFQKMGNHVSPHYPVFCYQVIFYSLPH